MNICRLVGMPGLMEAKRVHSSVAHMGARQGIRLVFRLDSVNGRIELVDIFQKNHREMFDCIGTNSGRHSFRRGAKGGAA